MKSVCGNNKRPLGFPCPTIFVSIALFILRQQFICVSRYGIEQQGYYAPSGSKFSLENMCSVAALSVLSAFLCPEVFVSIALVIFRQRFIRVRRYVKC